MNQRGFIALPMLAWGAMAAGAVILALGIAVKVQSSRLDNCKADAAAFQATVKAQGEVAAKEAARVNLVNVKAKEVSDATLKRLSDYNIDLNKRLRYARANSGFLPNPPANSPSPDRACFGRAELESALQRLDDGVSGLIGEGDQAKLRLSTSAEWAQSIGKP